MGLGLSVAVERYCTVVESVVRFQVLAGFLRTSLQLERAFSTKPQNLSSRPKPSNPAP